MDKITAILEALANKASLTSEQLAEKRAELVQFIRETPDTLNAEYVQAMNDAASAISDLDGEVTSRTELANSADEIRNRFNESSEVVEEVVVVAPEAPEAPVEEVAATDPVPVPVAASVDPSAIKPATPSVQPRTRTLVAAAGIPNMQAGTELSALEAAQALIDRARSFRGPSTTREQIPVVRYDYSEQFGEDRYLKMGDVIGNTKKLAAVISSTMRGEPDPLTASGGICAPLSPDYSFLRVSTDVRPVRDSLPAFRAERGGIRFNDPIPFTEYNDAITVWTVADDEDATPPASTPRKNCLRVDCGTETEVQIEAIVRCLEFGNLGARSYPELVADAMAKSMDAHARVAENELLAAMEANSTFLTWAKQLGAFRDVLYGLALYVASFRQRHRTDPNMTFQAWAPAYLQDMLRLDLMRQAPGDSTLAESDAEIAGYLRANGIDMTWYIDGTPGMGFGAFATGAIDQFPNPVEVLVAHAGAHVFLDQGSLDLGIVRDSTLNLRNDYQVFNETFEGLATPGFDPAVIQFTVCPSGEASTLGTAPTCLTGTGS